MSGKQTQKAGIEEFGFFRVAAAVPRVWVGDVNRNVAEIKKLIREAHAKGVSLIVFPELSITGYTLGDLFHQDLLKHKALEGLNAIRLFSKNLSTLIIVGLPMMIEGKLFNVAACVSRGEILGIVPKTNLPGYKEFYEKRWFSSGRDLVAREIVLFGKKIAVGTDILFRAHDKEDLIVGVEICEDVWMPLPPSSFQAVKGAVVIANLSASNELVGKAEYRRTLVAQQSARGMCGYVYASCGVHESTTDLVFSGHAMIAENGNIMAESGRFSREDMLIISDIDIERCLGDRARTTSFGDSARELADKPFRFVEFRHTPAKTMALARHISKAPFYSTDPAKQNEIVSEVFQIQVAGLAKRLEQTGIRTIVMGLSGGLDSTLALLVAVRTFALLGYPLKNIHAYTMPGFGTTKRTKSNAVRLAETLGISIEEINITKGATQQFEDIGHATQNDITFENVQARYRTMILMNKANQLGGIVLGTGDLSEIALGWSTFNGDHMSHYNVNAGVPKTLVQYCVTHAAMLSDFSRAKKILLDIVATPISPELLSAKGNAVHQKTEDIVGPYELHDFFLYHFVRWGTRPKKILYLAEHAFDGVYSRATLRKWLTVFVKRFFGNQWKRSVMPDGPKVGSVALSPRGDWRMPSDAEVTAWLKEI